jgi:hypothetical protein
VRFRSRIDWWLAALLLALPVIGLITAIALQLSGDGGAFVGWLSLLGIGLLYVSVVWPVTYELAAEELVIRFGLVRSRLPYAEIRGVAPTRSMLAAPALSMDRLAIDVGGRTGAVISPDDRSGFLDALAQRASHLTREGDRLVAR